MAANIGRNLNDLSTSLSNVTESVFKRFPIFFLVFIWILGYALMFFTRSKNKMKFILCVLISLVSIIMYSQTKKYAETMLSFMIGVLTIFTISWDSSNSKIFISFYIGINIVFFFLSAISLASKIETELTHAASYLNQSEFNSVYTKLNSICNTSTKFNLLSNIDKSEVIKHLAYARVDVELMYDAIVSIEMIKVVYALTVKEACDFYKDIYFVILRSSIDINMSSFLDMIFGKVLPITPKEFIDIFDKTKKQLISGKLDIQEYLDNIEMLLYKGYSNDEIVTVINA